MWWERWNKVCICCFFTSKGTQLQVDIVTLSMISRSLLITIIITLCMYAYSSAQLVCLCWFSNLRKQSVFAYYIKYTFVLQHQINVCTYVCVDSAILGEQSVFAYCIMHIYFCLMVMYVCTYVCLCWFSNLRGTREGFGFWELYTTVFNRYHYGTAALTNHCGLWRLIFVWTHLVLWCAG